MNHWEDVRKRQTIRTRHKYGHKALLVEQFDKRFIVLDTKPYEATEKGPYDGPCASCFFDPEPIFLAHWGGIAAGDVVLDIGSNIGSYTLPALALGATVLAFEPSKPHREILERNIAINYWNFRSMCYDYPVFDGGPYPEGLAAYAKSAGLDFSGYTFKIDSFKLNKCDWIKIDVEGAELGVILGSLETIQKHLPNIVIEDHDGISPGSPVSDYPASIDSSKRIRSLLLSLGYILESTVHDISRKYVFAQHPSRMKGTP